MALCLFRCGNLGFLHCESMRHKGWFHFIFHFSFPSLQQLLRSGLIFFLDLLTLNWRSTFLSLCLWLLMLYIDPYIYIYIYIYNMCVCVCVCKDFVISWKWYVVISWNMFWVILCCYHFGPIHSIWTLTMCFLCSIQLWEQLNYKWFILFFYLAWMEM